ncbi:hypothetical protein BJ944DRAFT_243404 [Cunninghamella echinulata]|nr:hypothetical protein BJ944DRAFT_243404 [Cunninghamella echinulata]
MDTQIKTILIVGKTGSGKSTLANVLCGNNVFHENHSSIRETKSCQFVLGNYEEDDNKNAKELLTFIRTIFILYEDSKVVQKYKVALLTKTSGYLAEYIKGCCDILCVNHPSNSPKQDKDLMKDFLDTMNRRNENVDLGLLD